MKLYIFKKTILGKNPNSYGDIKVIFDNQEREVRVRSDDEKKNSRVRFIDTIETNLPEGFAQKPKKVKKEKQEEPEAQPAKLMTKEKKNDIVLNFKVESKALFTELEKLGFMQIPNKMSKRILEYGFDEQDFHFEFMIKNGTYAMNIFFHEGEKVVFVSSHYLTNAQAILVSRTEEYQGSLGGEVKQSYSGAVAIKLNPKLTKHESNTEA